MSMFSEVQNEISMKIINKAISKAKRKCKKIYSEQEMKAIINALQIVKEYCEDNLPD